MFLVTVKLLVILKYPTCSVVINHIEQYQDNLQNVSSRNYQTLKEEISTTYFLPNSRQTQRKEMKIRRVGE